MTHASQATLRNPASRSALRPLAQALAACSMLTLGPFAPDAQAQALPAGLHVASGQAQVGVNGQTMTVTNSASAILNWQSFNIGASNMVRFQQPNAASQVLNRVTGKDPSAILGQLNSNGKVWLINPNGVLFGRNARVDVAGLVASTLDVDDSRWRSGQYAFSAATGVPDANVTNLGQLHSSLGGRIALLGGNVSNDGLIEAPGGQVLLAAGRSMDLVDTGVPNLTLRVIAPQGEALNLGNLSAPGGRVDIQAAVVNQQGIVRADALDRGPGGAIVLRASSALTLAQSSTTTANGAAGGGSVTLDAGAGTALVAGNVAATALAGTGGTIALLGRHVGALDGAGLDASGGLGGGSIFMGGGERGQDTAIANAEAAYVAPHARLRADALQRGDGGNIVLWSDDATRAYGSFSARGGPGGGNGGAIETSGGWLDARPASVDASAPAGRAGRWLLDPNDLTIVNGDANTNVNTTSPDFSTTDDGAVLGTLLIESALNSGQNVTITTSRHGANTQAGDIWMNDAAIDVNPSTDVSLTISAARNISLRGSSITIVPPDIIIGTGDGPGPKLAVSLLAAAGGGVGTITLDRSTIFSNGGNILLGGGGQAVDRIGKAPFVGTVGYSSTDGVVHDNGVTLSASSLDAGAGNITINGATTTGSNAGAAGVYLLLSSVSGADVTINGWASGQATKTGVRLDDSSLRASHAFVANGTAHGAWSDESWTNLSGVEVGDTEISTGSDGFDDSSRLVLNGSAIATGTPVPSARSANYGVQINEGSDQLLRGPNGGVFQIQGRVDGDGSGQSVSILGRGGARFDASEANQMSIQGTGPSLSIVGADIVAPFTGSLQIASSGALSISDTASGFPVGFSAPTRLSGTPAKVDLEAGTDLTFTRSSINVSTSGSSESLTVRAGASGSYGILSLNDASISSELPVHLQGNAVWLLGSTRVYSDALGDAIVVSGPNNDNVASFHDDIDSLATATYGGRWLVYATDPFAEHFQAAALGEDFRQYDVASPSAPIASSGNGILFSLAPTLTFTGNPSKTYDGSTGIALSSETLAIGGVAGSDQVYLGEGAFGNFVDKNAGTGKGITLDPDALYIRTAGGAPIYGYGNGPIAGTITPKTITFGDVTAASKAYDGNTKAAITPSAPGIRGLVGDESLVVTTTGTFDTKDAGGGKLVTVDFNVADGGGGGLASNYTWTSGVTTRADITPRAITLLDVTAANKVYDGNTMAAVGFASGGVIGLVGDETLVVTPSGTFDSKNVGSDKLVTLFYSTADGSNGGRAGNYQLAAVPLSAHADITQKPITFGDWAAANKVYDGTTAANIAPSPVRIDGLVGEETLVVAPTGTFDTKNAGTRKVVTVDFSVANGSGGGLAANYSWSSAVTTHADITPRPVTFGDLAAANKVYDGNNAASVNPVSVGGLVADETLVVTPTGTFDTKNAGTAKLVTVDFSVANGSGGGLASNYSWSSAATTHADITPKPVTFSDLAAANKVYDGNNAASVNPVSVGGLVADETLVVTPTGTFDTKNAGTRKVVTVDFSVANGSGGGLASNYSWSASATTHADVTARPITFGDLVAANKVYDGSTSATIAPVGVGGLVGDETLVVAPTGTFDTKNAGTGKVVTVDFSVANGGGGGLASNYSWSSAATTHADITPRPIAIGSLAAADKTYDGTRDATVVGVTLDGLVGSETLGIASSGRFDTRGAGNGKTVTVDVALSDGSHGGLASNYAIASSTGTTTASIQPKAISVDTLTAADKTYDGTTSAVITAWSLLGVVEGDQVRVAAGSGAFTTPGAGTGKTVIGSATALGGVDAGNYVFGSNRGTGSADIAPATLTYAAGTANGIAGAPVVPLTGRLTGFVPGDTQADATAGALTWSTPATSGSAAGSYAVMGGGLSAANYVFVQSPDNSTALTLAPLPPAATSVGSVNTSLASSLQSVQVATVATTSSQGRVLDVTAALQVGSTEGDAAFGSLPLAQMSRDSLAALLAARDAYKRDLFANAIAQLQKDPGAADLGACTTAGQVETGECLITVAQRDKARAEYLARADVLDALPPTAAGPAAAQATADAARIDALPAAASSAAAATDPIAVLDALASPAPLIEKRQIRNAALPQIQRKVAVVIGVDQFDDKRIPALKNAVSDAKSVATMLESSLGYETIAVENATRKSVIKTLNRLAAEVGPADSVIVYYAGHGELVTSTGLGYWQLADADADKPETWLSNVDIGKLLGQFGASQVALVSDSCYSGSLVAEQIRASADKLDPTKVLAGRAVVVMSSGGNEPVFDSGKDGHSTFASSLMQRLQQVSAWQAGGNVFEGVRFDVARQLPQHPQYGASVAAGHQDGTDYLFEQRQLDALKP